MPEFVLNRTHNIIARGHNIRFEKGVPTYVPPELVKDAVAIGAECVEGDVDVLGPEEAEQTPLTPDEKEALFYAQFDEFVARNDREDFDASGTPAYETLRERLPFSFSRKERNAVWQKYVASKAE